MAKTKQIPIEKRAQIEVLRNLGKTHREIARIVGVSKTGVVTTLKRFAETESFVDKKRSGRPKKTTASDERLLLRLSQRDRFKTAPDLRAEVNKSLTKPISVMTVSRILNKNGIFGRVAARKPLLRKVNMQKRLVFAKKHKDWTVEDWKSVLWTDESKFEIFGSKRRQYVRRKEGERFDSKCITPTVKHGGGSVMVWGGFSFDGVGELVRINGIMKKEQYHNILVRSAIPSGIGLIGYGFTFQQDNDPKHTSKLCRNYLESKENEGVLQFMTWPPQSPDINPIEMLWEELDREVRKLRPTSQTHLWQCLEQSWYNLEPGKLHKLVERMPRICKAVIKAKGGYFDEKRLI